MALASRRFILQGAVFGVACACAAVGAASAQTAGPPKPGQRYMCPPCGCSADGKVFDAPGPCPDTSCGMALIPAPSAPPKP